MAPAMTGSLQDFLQGLDLKEHAALRIVTKAPFNFKIQTLEDKVGPVDVLDVGRYVPDGCGRRPLLARIDTDGLILLYQAAHGYGSQPFKIEAGIVELYPDQGDVLHDGATSPFRLVAPHLWPTQEQSLAEARKTTRSMFSSLVKFAFILRGKYNSSGNMSQLDLLVELKTLCSGMQTNKDGEEATATPSVRNDKGIVQAGEGQTPLGETSPAMPSFPMVARSKRSATGMIEPNVQPGFDRKFFDLPTP